MYLGMLAGSRSEGRVEHTFVPCRLSQNLIACSTIPRDIFGFVVLLDGTIMILGIPTETIEGRDPRLILNSFDIDTGHWVHGRRNAVAGHGHAIAGSGR
jgi:hypothetical protein